MLILPERCSGAAGSHMTLDALPVKAPEAVRQLHLDPFTREAHRGPPAVAPPLLAERSLAHHQPPRASRQP